MPSASAISIAQRPLSWICVLPGSRGPIALCHEADLNCDVCTRRIAWFLAREMQYDAATAINRSAEGYRAEFADSRPCSMEQARELRRATVLICSSFSSADFLFNGRSLVLADEQPQPFLVPPRPHFSPDTPLTVAGRVWRFLSAPFRRGAEQ